MAKSTEIERRFLLLDFDHNVLAQATHDRFIDIRQGYFDTPPELDFRVRVINDEKAVMTAKIGSGIAREEDEESAPAKLAEWMLQYMPYKIHKHRHLIDGFEVDVFQDILGGIVLAEREADDAATNLQKPSWVNSWIEVTESLSNRHMAHLAHELEHLDGPVSDIAQFVLPRRVRKIVITGGPCSGKSTLLEMLKREMGHRIHYVPEVATIVISQVGVQPPVHNRVEMMRFQRLLGSVQRQFEGLSAIQALVDDKNVLVLDRGIVDNAAYLPNGLNDLQRIFKTTVEYEYSRYDLVIHLRVPPPGAYEQQRRNNPARRETYTEACVLDQRISDVWSGHPHYHDIRTDDWQTKITTARHLIDIAMHKW